MSLRLLHEHKHSIGNFDLRFQRLFKEPNWKPIFFELVVAAAYASKGVTVTMLPETEVPTPDLELAFDTERVYAECKVKLHYEDAIIAFTEHWRRAALGDIAGYLKQLSDGFIVRVVLKDETAMPSVSEAIKDMTAAGLTNRNRPTYSIEIVPIEGSPAQLPQPISVLSAEFWRQTLGFNEWREWHDVLPGGHFKLVNKSNAMATSVQRPTLICVRCESLADNEINLTNAMRDASRRQLREHEPGLLHVLINANLFGLGEKASLDYVQHAAARAANELLDEYTRVFGVVFDIVKPPELGQHNVDVRRHPVLRNAPSRYRLPPPILLF